MDNKSDTGLKPNYCRVELLSHHSGSLRRASRGHKATADEQDNEVKRKAIASPPNLGAHPVSRDRVIVIQTFLPPRLSRSCSQLLSPRMSLSLRTRPLVQSVPTPCRALRKPQNLASRRLNSSQARAEGTPENTLSWGEYLTIRGRKRRWEIVSEQGLC